MFETLDFCGHPIILVAIACIEYVCKWNVYVLHLKPLHTRIFKKFDFYVVANLQSLLLLHVLCMSLNEMRIYYIKAVSGTSNRDKDF